MSYEEDIAFGIQQMLDADLQFPQEVYRRKPVKTHADHIRSMTDEELAKKIIILQQSAIAFVCGSLGYHAPSPEFINEGDLKNTIEWLKQPYKEET